VPQVGETTEQNNQTRRDEGPGAKAGAQHLTRPIAGPLRRPRSRRPKLTQPPRDQISRAVVAVLVAQQLGHPGCLDLRPLLEQTTQHRLERIELRGRRRSPITRRLLAPRQPGNRPPINLPSRRAISRSETPSRTNARTCAHSNALRTSAPLARRHRSIEPQIRGGRAISAAASGALFDYRFWRSIGRPASPPSRGASRSWSLGCLLTRLSCFAGSTTRWSRLDRCDKIL